MTAASEAPELLLQHHLKKLRLPTVLKEYEKLARQCAAENVRYLARLIELELIDREARMVERRIKAARFPSIKAWRVSTSMRSPHSTRLSCQISPMLGTGQEMPDRVQLCRRPAVPVDRVVDDPDDARSPGSVEGAH